MEQGADEMLESDVHSVLIDTGVKLLAPPPTVDELLALLENIEGLLGLLEQDPSGALQDALLPTLKGLVSDKLFRHSNMDVKVLVLSCIHELLRITAPEAPYKDDVIKEIFDQTLIALGRNLTLFSGRRYTKALHILETVAKVKSCLILLDIGCDALIIKMFQLLLDSIRSKHPDAVFSNMEVIMTMLIDESDELSLDLLKPLLTRVEKETQNISSLSWRLGVKVLKNCSDKVQPYLMKAVEQMRRDIEKYSGIVASIWPDVIAEENVIESAAYASNLVQRLGNGTAGQNSSYKSALVDGNFSQALVCWGKDEPLQIIANESGQLEALQNGEALPRLSGRKPNSTRKTEEGNKHFGVSGGRTSSKASRKRKNCGKPEILSKHLPQEKSPLQSKSVPLDQNYLGRGQAKKKFNMKNELVKKEVGSQSDSEMKDKTTAQNCGVEESPLRISKKSGVKEYRNELIGSRVKVWWPDDRKFYEGFVESYDPSKKKHKVVYVDGDVEILRLKKERWILLDDICTQRDREASLPGSSVASVRSGKEKGSVKEEHNVRQENTCLRSKKNANTSSSKRRCQAEVRKCGSKSLASSNEGFLAIKDELDTPTDDILLVKNELDTAEDDDCKMPLSEIILYTRRPRY